MKKLNVEIINNQLVSRGIKCLIYNGALKDSIFTCEKSHVWHAKYSNVKHSGTGCPVCSADKRSVDISIIKIELKERGIEILKYGGRTYNKSIFLCSHGHEWVTTLHSVKDRKTGCPICNGSFKLTLKEINEDLKHRDIKCLHYVGKNSGKSLFKCKNDHLWYSTVKAVKNLKSGCPYCVEYGGFNPGKKATLYCLSSIDGRYLKIGISNNYSKRIKRLRHETPFKFETLALLHHHDGSFIQELEKLFHKHFDSANLYGFDGATEWFLFNPNIIMFFRMNGV